MGWWLSARAQPAAGTRGGGARLPAPFEFLPQDKERHCGEDEITCSGGGSCCTCVFPFF